MNIPPFITSLTGISNEMVANAPKFFEVAKKIVEITEDTIFVAHNANFDYSFVRNEFKLLGFDFTRKTLDTVRLSRKLLPGHASYSLGKICDDLGISINGRHRAAGDALATVKLFDILLSKQEQFKELAFPEQFKYLKGIDSEAHKKILNTLPETTGVYYFYDDNHDLIYIGKSNNIKKRVSQHLRNSGSQKALEIRERIAEVNIIKTGSELAALLLESDEIKKHVPIYNRAQRRSIFAYGLYSHQDLWGYLQFSIERINIKHGEPVATFLNKTEAQNKLHQLIEKHELCQKLCGQYKTDGACFHYGINMCKGACIDKESIEDYNARANEMLASFTYESANFVIIDKGRSEHEKSAILIENGKYSGFGYIEKKYKDSPTLLKDCITKYPDNRDTRQIIKNYVLNKKHQAIIKL
jgi:DNA polymerase-3 subunit epsilon